MKSGDQEVGGKQVKVPVEEKAEVSGIGWGNSRGEEELAEVLPGDISRQVRVWNRGQAEGMCSAQRWKLL